MLGDTSINQSLEIFNHVVSGNNNISNLLVLVFSNEGRSSFEHSLGFLGTGEDVSLENELGILVDLAFISNRLNGRNSTLDGTNNRNVILILELLSEGLEIVNDRRRISNTTIEVVEINIGNV